MRKIQLFIILVLACVLASCHRKPVYPTVLLRADSLTYVDPRASLNMLDSLAPQMSSAPKPVRMYHQLLTVKASDKAYIKQTSDSLILSIADYYEHGGDKSLLPEAYYYLGSTYRDLGDAPQALGYYQKALDAMNGHENPRMQAPLYAQMGDLYDKQNLYDNALNAYRQAYHCDSLLCDTVGLIYDLRDIAYMHRCKDNLDSAKIYFRQAEQMANTQHDINLSNLVTSQIASLQIRLNDLDGALQTIQPSLTHINNSMRSSVYSIVSDIYFKQGRYDSATYYYRELLQHGDIYARRRAHERLAHIANVEHRYADAHEHLLQYEYFNDSIERITATATVEQMAALYNYEQREVQNVRLEAQNQRYYSLWIAAITLAIIIALLLIAVVLYYQKRRREQDLAYMYLDQLRKKESKDYEVRLAHSETERQELNTLYQAASHEVETIRQNALISANWHKEARAQIRQSALYQQMEDLARHARALPTEDWARVEQLVSQYFPTFIESLHALAPLNVVEYHVCLLFKLGMEPSDVVSLVPVTSVQYLSNIRRRIFAKVTSKPGSADDFKKLIESL